MLRNESVPVENTVKVNDGTTVKLVETFEYEFNGRTLRSFNDENNTVWIPLVDIADILEVTANNRVNLLRSLKEREKGTTICSTRGGAQEITVVSEPGFYKIVLRSRKPAAEPFTDWVTYEVLPEIRRHGVYIAESQLEAAKKRITELEQKVEYLDRLTSAEGTLNLTDTAKSIGARPKKMIEFLRNHYVLNAENIPYQRYIDEGAFKVVTSERNGVQVRQTYVTAKGVERIYNFLKRQGFTDWA